MGARRVGMWGGRGHVVDQTPCLDEDDVVSGMEVVR